ncbi:MAG TPA: hypothetical protein DDZ51_30675 [Planctomycetaceae bacterium]|nr:hypothetical protein [Planctomycetaceae bacterium]
MRRRSRDNCFTTFDTTALLFTAPQTDSPASDRSFGLLFRWPNRWSRFLNPSGKKNDTQNSVSRVVLMIGYLAATKADWAND